jgi:hypothetical protein
MAWPAATGDACACDRPLEPCPFCGELTCLACEDWERHHSFRGWFGRNWRRYVSKWFVP